jgi:putative heme-binding domain-containing protein
MEEVEAVTQTPIEIPKADPNNPDQIGNLETAVAARRALATTGDIEQGKALFEAQSCRACHTDADGQTPKGPHLVDIGQRYNPQELAESVLTPSAKIAQGFDTYTFLTTNGRVFTGFVVLETADAVRIREQSGLETELAIEDIEARQKQEQSMMPDGIVANLTPEQFAHILAYLRSLN